MKNRTLFIHLSQRSYLIMAVIVLLAALSVACNGNSADPAVEPTAVADAPPAAQPTDAPAAAPTEPLTAVPPTAEPTAPPTIAPTEAPPAASFGTGYCGNAFYPVIEGRVYHYGTTSSLGNSEYSNSYSDVTDSSFTITTTMSDDSALSANWQCTAEGLVSPQILQFPVDVGDLEVTFVDTTGLTIPSEDMFQVGKSWPFHYVATATMNIEGTFSMDITQVVDLTHAVTAIEAVSVPAGDFPNAVRVETTGTMASLLTPGATPQPGDMFPMNYTSWYVEGVGLVRSEMPDLFSTGSSNITELLAFE